MNLTVLVPSEDHRSTAGARIRYGRLAPSLGEAGISLRLEAIAKFDPATADCDALLISKCHDARTNIAAAILSRRGKLVGVDLFDDYFSQRTDSRLVRYRQWLSELLKDCHFCLCSTNAMAEVVQEYRPGLPAHVVNDPAREHSVEEALALADRKSVEANCQRVIRAAWFGVGDNPYFQVGLADLFAQSWALSALRSSGMAVELTVVTNRRALGPDGLELVSRLPVPTAVMEWSEEVEREALQRSLVAFLPVAAQSFSSAKSLNRALTALSYGCQVLSLGYPLYAALEPLIYREPGSLLSDLESGPLRLSAASLDVYRERLAAVGSAEVEALRLAKFMRDLAPRTEKDAARLCVVHGLATRAEVHDLTRSVGGLSVASPYCSANLDFDVQFRGLPPEMKMSVSSRVRVDAKATSSPNPVPKVRSRSFLKGFSRLLDKSADRVTTPASVPLSYELATYAASMEELDRRLREAFGPVRLIMSETSRLPVMASAEI